MAHISMADLFEKLRNFDSARKYLDIAISEFSEISNFDKENKESRAWLEKLKDRKKRGIGHVYH